MKRVFVVTLLGLAAAGCAQSRSALTKQDTPSPGAVAVTPVPSLDDTVNRGMGNAAIVKTAIKDPDNPQWSGRAPFNGNPRPPGGGPTPGQPPPQTASAGSRTPTAAPLAAQAPGIAGNSARPAQAADAVATPSTIPAAAGTPVAGGWIGNPAPASQAGSEPAAVSMPGPNLGPVGEPAGTIAGLPASGPIPVPPEPAVGGSAPPTTGPEIAGAAPPGSLRPAPGESATPRQAPRPAADPLLGPNPDLMPPIPDVSELDPRPVSKGVSPKRGSASNPPAGPTSSVPPESAVPSPKASAVKPLAGSASASKPPGPDPVPAAPAMKPAANPELPNLPELSPPVSGSAAPAGAAVAPAVIPLELAPAPPPGSAAGASPAATPQPTGSNDSAALTEPARAGSVAALPAPQPAPPASAELKVTSSKAPAPGPPAPRRDSQVVLTSGENLDKAASPGPKPKNPADERRRVVLPPGRPIAKVGDEIITLHDLTVATKEQLKRYPDLREAYLNPSERNEARKHINMLGRTTLDALIDRSLLVQDAKHHISKKDAKLLDRLYDEADRLFRESEILPLEQKYHVDTEVQLKEKLAEEGRSITQMQQSFRQMFLAEQYLHSKLSERIKVELPDLLKYYDEHVKKHEFDRPALFTWREIVVEPIVSKAAPNAPHDSTVLLTSEGTSREVARREADGLLEKLRRGEDFAKLARKESDGPVRSRNQGGLMETSPGGYGVPAVNQALESLPIGQLSGVIEGPDGFHIVKVEKRRSAGPASFEEVQDRIRPLLMNEKFVAERNAFLTKLRKNTLVTFYDLSTRKKPSTTLPN